MPMHLEIIRFQIYPSSHTGDVKGGNSLQTIHIHNDPQTDKQLSLLALSQASSTPSSKN